MIHLTIPGVPISQDQAYESVTKGKGPKRITVRRLSDEGHRYKKDVRAHVLRHYPEALNFFKPNFPYLLIISFCFDGWETLNNKSWLEEDPKKRAKTRYKRLDVSNRIKLFEDALAEAVGLDDNHNFFLGVGKTWSTEPASTKVWAFNREEERGNPVDDLLRQLTG